MNRISFDTYFLELAKAASLRADCTRSHVGAILVNEQRRVVSTGYNGVAPGAPGCLEGACPRGRLSYDERPSTSDYSDCISTHAERNCLLYTPVESRAGTTMYVTRRPCVHCKQLLFHEGVSQVVWLSENGVVCHEPLQGASLRGVAVKQFSGVTVRVINPLEKSG